MADVDREELGALLSAYLDGEVTAEEATFVERSIAEDEHARRLLEELRGTAKLVSSLPVHAAPKSIAEDLQFHAERSELLGDVDETPQIDGPLRVSSLSRVAVAAMLAIVVLGGWWFSIGPGARVSPMTGTRIVERDDVPPESDVSALDDLSETAARRDLGKGTPVTRGNNGLAKAGDLGARLETPGELGSKRKQRMGVAVGRRGGRKGFVSLGKEAVIVSADLEHKLATRPLTSLRQHRFENERVRVRISVKNPAQADAVTARLTSYLEADHVIDLTERPIIISDGSDAGRNFFYRGRVGRNFDEADQHQLLIRVAASKIDGLMEEFGRVAEAKDRVTLLIDSSSISGVDDARRALRGLRLQSEQQDGDGEFGLADALAVGRRASKQAVEVMAEEPKGQEESSAPILVVLLEAMFGLNLEAFVPAPQPPAYGPVREESASEMLAVTPRLGEDAERLRLTYQESSNRGTLAGPAAQASMGLAGAEPPGLVERRLRELAEKSASRLKSQESGPATSVPGAECVPPRIRPPKGRQSARPGRTLWLRSWSRYRFPSPKRPNESRPSVPKPLPNPTPRRVLRYRPRNRQRSLARRSGSLRPLPGFI